MKRFNVEYKYVISVCAENEEDAMETLDLDQADFLYDRMLDYTSREIITVEEE